MYPQSLVENVLRPTSTGGVHGGRLEPPLISDTVCHHPLAFWEIELPLISEIVMNKSPRLTRFPLANE